MMNWRGSVGRRRVIVVGLATVALVWLGVVASWNVCAAQVGHEPGQSPYRDIRRGGVVVFGVGYLGGSRGRVGVGMSDGITWNVHYDASLGGPVSAALGLAYAQTTRYIVDPAQGAATRTQGPVDSDVILADAVLVVIPAVVAASLPRLPDGTDRHAELGLHRDDLYHVWIGRTPAFFDVHFERVASAAYDVDGAVGIANPDPLRRLHLHMVMPFRADIAAVAEEVAAFAVAPLHVAECAQGAKAGRQMVFDVAGDVAEEQPDADDDAEQHAAANNFAAPRAPEPLDRCGLIQGHIHGHRWYGALISQVSPRRATARRG